MVRNQFIILFLKCNAKLSIKCPFLFISAIYLFAINFKAKRFTIFEFKKVILWLLSDKLAARHFAALMMVFVQLRKR